MAWIYLALIGMSAGVLSGLFGVGGGLLIVPALLWVMRFPMHIASAMSLVALSVPLGAWVAVHQYYVGEKITMQHILWGLMICLGLGVGAFFGARLSVSLDETVLRRSFAVFLAVVAILTWFKR